MARVPAVLAAIGLAAGVSACAPTMAVNGFQAVDLKPKDVKVGDTRSSVLLRLGSPSTQGTFDPNVWYYISQKTEKYAYYMPRVQSREVVAIAFDKDDKVASVKDLQLKDGYEVAYDRQATPTRGKQLNWLGQLLGNIGRGNGMLPQDYDPGRRPGGGGP
jgi:outer membrane protein assembly factor BamE (lipoprotein component of BamABCDE complex)